MTPESQSVANVAIASLLHASWQAGVLALVVLAVLMVAGRRLDPRVRFGLWLVVFARLAMPVVPAAPWSLFGWFLPGPVELTIPADGMSVVAAGAPVAGPEPTVPRAAIPSAGKATGAPIAPPTTGVAAHWSVSAWGLAVSIWLVGMLVLIVRLVLGAMRLGRAKRRWQAPAEGALAPTFKQCRRQLGIRPAVSLWISDDGIGPATLGCFRASIVIPRDLVARLSSHDLRLVLVHELLHVRRRDVPIDRLACLLTAVHWPNPLAWIALACLRQSRELACDVALLDRLGGEQARHYGHLILSTLEMLPATRLQPAAVGIFERSAGLSLKERIRLIAGYRKPSRGLAVLTAALVLLAALVGLTDAQTSEPRVPEKMLADGLKAAQFQWNAVAGAYRVDTISLDRYLASADDLLEAELAMAKSDEERLAANDRHVKNFKAIEEKIELLYNRGERGGEANKYAAANYCLQTAEIELLRQQLAAQAAGDRPPREARLKQLLVERVDTARTMAMAYGAAFEAETDTLDDVIWAIDARWKAELAAAENSKDKLAAHVERVRSLMQLEQKITALFNVGARGGEAEKHATIKAARKAAELELVALCIAQGQPYPQRQIASGATPKLSADESLQARQKRLLAERVVSARQAKDATQAAYEAETVPFGALVAAIEAKWRAELAVATTPEEIIAAHVRHVQDFGDRQLAVESLYNVAAIGGEAEKVGTARYHCQAADVALAKACLAANQQYPKFDRHPNVTVPEPDSAESTKP